jgi:translation initiation factor 3 subunit B
MSANDLNYYRQQPDYDDFADYLDLTPVAIDEAKELPKFVPDYSSAIVLDGIPIVNQEKATKLYGVLLKVFSATAPIQESDIFMPFDPTTGLSQGYCFIKFGSKEDADNAVKVSNGFALDKKHTFKANSYSELDYYSSLSENDQPPTLADFHPKPEVVSWLADPLCRDQFAIRYNKETEIYWANGNGEGPSLQYGAEREKKEGKLWCELTVEWSPQGTYFVTFHKAGVKVWGGADFQPQGRFMHPNVEEISFSPCERYIITYRLTDPYNNPSLGNNQENIIIWDVRTGEKLKTFAKKSPFETKFTVTAQISQEPGPTGRKVDRMIRGRIKGMQEINHNTFVYQIEEGAIGSGIIHEVLSKDVKATQDPNKMKWSADGNYLAKLSPDIISVFELPSMNLLDKRSFSSKDIQDFSWSPSRNLLGYFSPAVGNYPAVINILKVPEREDVVTRKIVDVIDGKMIWQNDGDYLCVTMTKVSGKNKKSYVLMFFRVKDSGIPVEQTEFNEPIHHVAWEPSGDRLAIMYGDHRSPSIAFYSMINKLPATTGKGGITIPGTTKNELTHLFTKPGNQCSELQWSPAGGVVSLAYFPGDACVFELFDVDNNSVLANRKHDRATKLVWDPSGRYLASATITELRNINARGQPDDGINFYTFQGTILSQFKKEKCFGFHWRPRPKDIMTAEEKKNILKNLKKYEKEFEKKDKARKNEVSQALQAARYKIAEEFVSWRNRNRSICATLKPRRIQLRDGYDSDDDRNYEIDRMVRNFLTLRFFVFFRLFSSFSFLFTFPFLISFFLL